MLIILWYPSKIYNTILTGCRLRFEYEAGGMLRILFVCIDRIEKF